jgi:hypothetical protein
LRYGHRQTQEPTVGVEVDNNNVFAAHAGLDCLLNAAVTGFVGIIRLLIHLSD